MAHPITSIPGPSVWASYLVNGDSSGLEPGEKAKADAWLKREGIRIVDVERDSNGECLDPYFSWHADVYVPELGFRGAELLDYRCEELTIEEDSK